MKLSIHARASLPLAISALALALSTTAHAAAYSSDDLLLGVRKPGVANNYVLNIGQASAVRDASGIITFSLGDINTDLTTVFGAGWAADPAVVWSVSGTTGSFNPVGSDPLKTLYATRAEGSPGVQAPAWTIASSTIRSTTTTRMTSFANTYSGFSATGNSPTGVIQPTSTPNSYADFMPGGSASNVGGSPGISFGAFNSTIEAPVSAPLSLFRIPNTAAPAGFLGTFNLSNTGSLSFAPVPEPAATACLAAVAGLLTIRRRRL